MEQVAARRLAPGRRSSRPSGCSSKAWPPSRRAVSRTPSAPSSLRSKRCRDGSRPCSTSAPRASGCTGRSRRSPPPTRCSPPSRATSTPSASAPSRWPAWACRSRRSPPTTGWSRPIRTWPRCGASAAACCARWAGSKRPRRRTREARDAGRRLGAQRLLPRRRRRRHAAAGRAARLRRRPVRRLLGRVRRPSRRRPRLPRPPTCWSRTCPSRDRRFASVLDLGCGTGLCGPLLKPRSRAPDRHRSRRRHARAGARARRLRPARAGRGGGLAGGERARPST